MNKEMLISLKTKYNDECDCEGEYEISVKGQLQRKGDEYLITYREPRLDEPGEHPETVIRVGEHFADITHTGELFTSIYAERGKRHQCVCHTPYGEAQLGVTAQNLTNTLGDNGGQVFLKYSIDINKRFSSTNEMILNVTAID